MWPFNKFWTNEQMVEIMEFWASANNSNVKRIEELEKRVESLEKKIKGEFD